MNDTLTLSELRQWIADQAPGAVGVIASALGTTAAQLNRAVENGEVTKTAVIVALVNMWVNER